MKQILFALPGLLVLLLIPHSVAASSCGEEPMMTYYLECQNGLCKGFKVQDEPTDRPCTYLPQMPQFVGSEGDKIVTYLTETGRMEATSHRRQLIATLPTFCVKAVITRDSETLEFCSQYNELYVNVEQQPNIKPLAEWRQEVNAMVEDAHRAFRLQPIRNFVSSFVFVILMPIGLCIFLSRKNRSIFLFITFGLMGLQGCILCFVTFVGILNGWPLLLMSMLSGAILLEGLYFIFHEIQRKRVQLLQS